MKKLLILALISISSVSFSQKGINLETIIPNSTKMVLRINGKALTKKVGLKNIAKSQAFLKMIEGEIFLGNQNKRITDLGINLENDVFMVYEASKNISYTAYLYHIEKPKLFGKYISEKNEFVETEKTDKYTVIHYKKADRYYNETRDFLAWNDSYAIYFDVSYVRDRKMDENDETGYVEDYPMDAMDAVEEAADAIREDIVYDNEYYAEKEAERIAREKKQDSLKEVQRLEKLVIVRENYKNELERFFNPKTDHKTILSQESYLSNKSEKADVSFWVNIKSGGMMPMHNYRSSYYRRYDDMPGIIMSYLSMYAGKDGAAHLFFNDNNISVKSNIEFTPEVGKTMEGIYNSSLPKSYLKYINSDKLLGVTSSSINSTKFWEAFPSMYADAFVMMDRGFRNGPSEKVLAGVDVLVDFMSIMMDEEALGKLMTGDAVFVLKDLVEKEVEYYTYEYNEDYSESKKIKKTKTEVFPDFLLMFGSENRPFMAKLLDLAVKNEALIQNGSYYYTDGKSRDLPFVLYFTLTDEMAFISTSVDEIKQISEGTITSNVDKKLSTNLMKNSSYFNLDLPTMLAKIPIDQLSERELRMMEYFRTNGGEIEWFNNFVDDQVLSNMTMKSPSTFKNSALFIWDLMENADQF
ncbi:MAG: hypothetical protein AB8B74_08055 [Crocinitomicaceae bacterium]